jgi:putative aldouronate transport system substrate-binding protein
LLRIHLAKFKSNTKYKEVQGMVNFSNKKAFLLVIALVLFLTTVLSACGANTAEQDRLLAEAQAEAEAAKAEAEAAKAEAAAAREEADKAASEASSAATEAQSQADTAKAEAEKAAAEKLAAETALAEAKTAEEKAAAEKVLAEKALAEKEAAEKAAVAKAAADKAAADKAAADKIAAEKADLERRLATTKYSPAITLTTVKVNDVARTFENGNTFDNNEFTKKLEAELGIKVKYLWSVDITQANAKMATMIASGELPDYFYTTDAALASTLMREGFTADITDIYPKLASESLKAQDASDPIASQSATINGRMLGIPGLSFGPVNNTMSIWIRNDWLQATGKPVPKTMAELVDVAKAFRATQGAAYGIAVDKTLTNPSMNTLIPFMNGFGAYSKIWIKKNGKLEYSSIQPEMRTALKAFQDWYKAGLIDKEFSVKDSNRVDEDIVNGKVGIVGGMPWLGWASLGNAAKKAQADGKKLEWKYIAIPLGGTNKDVKVQSPFPVPGYWLINKEAKNPEAVIKMMSWFMDNEVAGTWTDPKFQKESGGVFGGSPINQSTPGQVINNMLKAHAAIKANSDASLTNNGQKGIYTATKNFLDKGDLGLYGRYLQYGPGQGADVLYQTYVKTNKVLMTELKGTIPEGYAVTKSSLDKLEDDYFTQIIMGADIKLFDEFVTKWKQLGGNAATEEVNRVFNR